MIDDLRLMIFYSSIFNHYSLIMRLPFSRYKVHGKSMLPVLKEGQEVLVWRWFYHPKKGDIIAIYKNCRNIIKRIHRIRGKEIFVQGDNKDGSTDSRNFGPLLSSEIIGKVILIVR